MFYHDQSYNLINVTKPLKPLIITCNCVSGNPLLTRNLVDH